MFVSAVIFYLVFHFNINSLKVFAELKKRNAGVLNRQL